MPNIQIVLPEYAVDDVSEGLRYLTRVLMEAGEETSGGLLGGEYGYGVNFENDVFMMHPYCWCEQDDCAWCDPCLCGEDAFAYVVDGVTVEFEAWLKADNGRRGTLTFPERQCERCRTNRPSAPNFLHKPSGSTVRWYKYIGRGMEVELGAPWRLILEDCLRSVTLSTEGLERAVCAPDALMPKTGGADVCR